MKKPNENSLKVNDLLKVPIWSKNIFHRKLFVTKTFFKHFLGFNEQFFMFSLPMKEGKKLKHEKNKSEIGEVKDEGKINLIKN
jgi:hypothetical protein